jgi:hypothetical protein
MHEKVHTLNNGMRKVTLSADQGLIERARLVARSQGKTLNAAFREWLEQYAAQAGGGAAVDALKRASSACARPVLILATR